MNLTANSEKNLWENKEKIQVVECQVGFDDTEFSKGKGVSGNA